MKVAGAIEQIFKWFNGSPIRRTRAFKKAAWDYVATNERKDLKDSTKKQYFTHFKKRMRAYQ